MTPLFRKLNLTTQSTIHVLDAPGSFDAELALLEGVEVRRELDGPGTFVIAFAVTRSDVDRASARIAASAKGDAIVWMAYPKASSRRYRCEFNRDTGWAALGEAGFEAVRQVAIDEDWSALRFRRVEFIKSMTRHPAGAISAAGRARTSST